VPASQITATLLPTLGVSPSLGRAFTAEEDRPNGAQVVILSHALWTRRFGADRSIIGRTVQIDGVTREIIGVMPRGFHFPDASTALWLPMKIDPAALNPFSFNRYAIGRLKPGVSIAQAEATTQPLLMRVPDEMPSKYPVTRAMLEQAKLHVVVHPMRDDVVGNVKPILFLVLGTVGVVLLIACANIANLFLVRAEGRQREIAVRTAIGARPSDVARLFLSEAMTLVAGGAIVGVVVAWLGLRGLLHARPDALPRADEITLDGAALGIAALVAVIAGLLFGILPLLRTRSTEHLVPVLKEGTRGTVGRERQRLRNAFVVAQVALALVLLAGSGLLARSFLRMRDVDPGFRSTGVLTLRLSLPTASYKDAASVARFYQQLLDRLTGIPGVQGAGAITKLPLVNEGNNNSGTWVEDHPPAPNAVPTLHPGATVNGTYFQAMGIPLVHGRPFDRTDPSRASDQAIVSVSFAKKYWPAGSAIGKRIRQNPEGPWQTIVGVVGDVHSTSLTEPADAMVYFPTVMGDGKDSTFADRSMAIAVRTTSTPESITSALRREVWALDPNLPLVNIRPMETVLSNAMARTSFTLLMVGVAAGVALLLGAIGIYGVISYMVSLRTREIGVRMALGARSGQVGAMVVRQGIVLATIGVVIGLAGSFAVTRFLTSLLFGVSPNDPLTLASVATTLLVIASVASWLPARRASRIDPVEALRAE
jgi:putative ABC transport system permease protein